MIKVLSLPVDMGGCGWYRVRQPLSLIKKYTKHDVHIIDKNEDVMEDVVRAFVMSDIILMRPGAEDGLAQILKIPGLENLTAKIVMDIDDNVEIISPYSAHYREYGVEEFYDKNAKEWLWKDGKLGWDREENRKRMEHHLKGLNAVDLVTVTTPKLAEYALQYNRNVTILPNCINFENWKVLPLKPNKQLRVGWAGGSSHYEDLYTIKEPLNQLLREFKFKMYFIGVHFPGLIDDDNKHLVEAFGWVPFEAHPYRMATFRLDAAIIPLADLPFNYYKSAIKWYEMAALEIPSVVSNITPYKEEINPGVTALAYNTPKQFYKALKTLLTKPQVRKNVGKAALKWVKTNRDAEKCAKLWTKAYGQIISAKRSGNKSKSKARSKS